MAPLLLIALLTLCVLPSSFAAPILQRNITIVPQNPTDINGTTVAPKISRIPMENVTIVSIAETTTPDDFGLGFENGKTSNSSLPETMIVVETGDNHPNSSQIVEEDGTAFVNLEADSESTEDENKIETKVDVGDAPKIISHVIAPMQEPVEVSTRLPDGFKPIEAIPNIDDEDFSDYYVPSDAPEYVEPERMNITAPPVSESSIPSPFTSTTPKPIPVVTPLQNTPNATIPSRAEVIIPTDDTNITASTLVYDLRYNGTEMDLPRDNANLYPKTVWEETNQFLAVFTKEHPKVSIIVAFVAFVILFTLVMLVIRECFRCGRCNRRCSPRRIPRSITADLYNTSSCSQYYKPMILPNQENVTMQLIPSDVSSDTL